MSTPRIFSAIMVNMQIQNLPALMHRLEVQSETIQLFFLAERQTQYRLTRFNPADNLTRQTGQSGFRQPLESFLQRGSTRNSQQ